MTSYGSFARTGAPAMLGIGMPCMTSELAAARRSFS
jgi:hypothetical protein